MGRSGSDHYIRMHDSTAPVYLARQPIFDGKMLVYGYELLYRRGHEDGAGEMSTADSARSLSNALVEIGLNELVGRSKAFVNVTEEMILSGALEAFPKGRVVFEILEDVRPTPEIVESLKKLRASGYVLALDDFLWNDLTVPLIPLVEIVKVDIAHHGLAGLGSLVQMLDEFPGKLLAERVETHEEHQFCRSLGFQLFQGFFMSKPEIVEGKALRSNHMALVRLLSRMNAPDLTFDELESIVASDVQLNVQILKFVKSAYLGLPGTVDSIRKALLFVGMNTLASIATLLIMSRFTNKPNELVFTAMLRAKMAEEIGSRFGSFETDRHFTVGMLSVLDALLDTPMPELLKQLPLPPEMGAALIAPVGDDDLAKTLRTVLAYERGDFDAVEAEYVPIDVASRAYRNGLTWAGQTQLALAA